MKTGFSTSRWVTLLGGAVAAAVVLLAARHAHLHAACVERDTPYLPICAEPATDPKVIREDLRERIARNPGESRAWARLLVAEGGSPQVLPGANLAAPNHPNVVRQRAIEALQAGKLPEAVAVLVELLRHRTAPDAAKVVAGIATTPEGMAALHPHLAHGEWLPQTLDAVSALKLPPGALLPLVAKALDQGVLPDQARQYYMRSLKASGAWLDAYGLWLAQHKEPVPLLYNGGFDQLLEQDGFDWEFAVEPRSRAGAVVRQEAVARRGLVLAIEFTGRSFSVPLVRQHVFAPPGTYRMRGEYMATKFRSEAGLTWTLHCTAGRKLVAGRSRPVLDTGGVWRQLEIEVAVPPDCGTVAVFQLEPTAAYEGPTGMRGLVAFDNFSLLRSAATP